MGEFRSLEKRAPSSKNLKYTLLFGAIYNDVNTQTPVRYRCGSLAAFVVELQSYSILNTSYYLANETKEGGSHQAVTKRSLSRGVNLSFASTSAGANRSC